LTIEIDFTPDQKAFARKAIETGRFHSAEEVVQEALSVWEDRERRRVQILASVDSAEASIRRGEGRVINAESMRQLADEVKQRGRAGLVTPAAPPYP
jgi:putative addiction module CopG family antidote